MSKTRIEKKSVAVLATIALLTYPFAVTAYVGPGPGLSFISSLIGLLGAIFTSIFFLVIWPIRKLLRVRKNNRTIKTEAPQENKDK